MINGVPRDKFAVARRACIFLLMFLVVAHSLPAYAGDVAEGGIIGVISHYKVQGQDNFYKIARHFDTGFVPLLSANAGVDPRKLNPGADLVIPSQHVLPNTPRTGIVINLAEMRLYYFPDPHTVVTFPIGIGMDGWQTLTGNTTIIRKRRHPVWTPPDSIRKIDPGLPVVIPAGPHNPLGNFALNLGWPGYLIHGTNSPNSIGKRSSHGCIRLYPEDIARLFAAVDIGTPVLVIDEPYKLGWQQDKLYLEVTPMQNRPVPEIYGGIGSFAGEETVDWVAVQGAIARHDGIPVSIATRTHHLTLGWIAHMFD